MPCPASHPVPAAAQIDHAGRPDRRHRLSLLRMSESTGSVFGVRPIGPKSACTIDRGRSQAVAPLVRCGRWLDNTSARCAAALVYWYAEFAPDDIGVSDGNFADPASRRRPLGVGFLPASVGPAPAGWPQAAQAAGIARVTRVASCSCGQLSVTLSGGAARDTVCHCLQWQKSTRQRFRVYAFGQAARAAPRPAKPVLAPLLGFRALGRELFLPHLRQHGLLAHGTGAGRNRHRHRQFRRSRLSHTDGGGLGFLRHPWVALPAAWPRHPGDATPAIDGRNFRQVDVHALD